MKKLLCALSLIFAAHSVAARYDAFAVEAKEGLDYVAVEAKDYSPDGELGREVYAAKVESPLDVFIPTTNYLRLGAGANIGIASTPFEIAGEKKEYDWGLEETFGLGWYFNSWLRAEFGWLHGDMRFGKTRANVDSANLMLYFDLARRYVREGDINYRRRIIPFIGIGPVGGYAAFDDKETEEGRGGWAYGARGAAGISFAFTETNALDFMFSYDWLTGNDFGWTRTKKNFGNANVSLSWRTSF